MHSEKPVSALLPVKLSSSNLIYQNPRATSSFEKYLAAAISLAVSSRFGVR